jgi:hypothetical protein
VVAPIASIVSASGPSIGVSSSAARAAVGSGREATRLFRQRPAVRVEQMLRDVTAFRFHLAAYPSFESIVEQVEQEWREKGKWGGQ